LNKTLNTSEFEWEKLRGPFVVPTQGDREALATKIASAFDGGRWLKGYIRGKLLADPVFDEGLSAILEKGGDVTDLGCGLGLLGLWLKSHGYGGKYRGCDLGGWKISAGNLAVERLGFADSELHEGDLADFSLGNSGTICAFDILHYLPEEVQEVLLRRLATAARSGSLVLIRNGVRGCGWRSSVTLAEEWWTRASGWIRGGTINFPELGRLRELFEEEGCCVEAKPLWGKTPFSSYWLKISARN
jgi:SAM-dependent methyltransferase